MQIVGQDSVQINSRILQSPTGRNFVVSDYASVGYAKEKLRSFVDLRDASRELGVSRPRIRLLLDAGLIRRETRRHKTGLRWVIPRAEIEKWLTPPCATDRECALRLKVSLAHVFKYRCRTDAAFIAIAQAFSVGTLRYVGSVAGLRGISAFLVPQEDANRVIAETSRLTVDGMTAQAVAKALSVKEEVIYHLMRKGLLEHRTYAATGRAIRLITDENLQTFCSTYVALADVARRWKMSPKVALKYLCASGFHPVTGPSVDGSRQYFYRSVDIDSVV